MLLTIDFSRLTLGSIFGNEYHVSRNSPSGALKGLGFLGITFPDDPWTSSFDYDFGFDENREVRWWRVAGYDLTTDAVIEGCFACAIEGGDYGRIFYGVGGLEEPRTPIMEAHGAGTWQRTEVMTAPPPAPLAAPLPAPALLLLAGLAGLGVVVYRRRAPASL